MRNRRMLLAVVVLAAALIAAFLATRPHQAPTVAVPVWTPIAEQRVSHGRFENMTVYVPHATPDAFVLLLSGSDGWTATMVAMARQLAAQGALVAGLDVAQIDAAFQADGAQCVYPDGDFENLSHFLQAYFHLPTYVSPILAGYSTGATLAYATLAQAPKNTFAGAVSIGFCPAYPLNKPLCPGSGIEFAARAQGDGVDFLPAKQLGNPWTVLQNQTTRACMVETIRTFVGQIPGARFVTLPSTDADMLTPSLWKAQYAPAFDTLMALQSGASSTPVPNALSDLPIVTVAAQPGGSVSDALAILLSGDGGWAGLDKEVAGALAASGIPVVGLDSLRYFWSARTPEGVTADIDRMASYYLAKLGKRRLILVGYSQGADVLPFAVNRLDAATRSHLALTVVMGLSEHALFEFHMSSWVSDDNSGPLTLPEVERISLTPVLCIYGQGETDTLCPKLDPKKVNVVELQGGHHFDGNYTGLADAILKAAGR